VTRNTMQDILDTLAASEDNTTSFEENWSQGRAAFGGLVAAFASLGMRKLLSPAPPLRSLMASFIAPLPPAPLVVEAAIQRQGRSVTQCSASVVNEGQVALQALGVFGNARPGIRVEAEPCIKPLPRSEGISFEEYSKRMPTFLNQFEGCWVGDAAPFSGSRARRLNMWVRHRCDMSAYPAEKLIAIADMPPPVLLCHYDKPFVPASSVSWGLEFVVDPAQVEGDWFYLDFDLDAAADGYTQQSGRIYEESGRLVALSRQCMAYFEQ
jgi:acyl-CoA thioesterase